MLGIISPDWNYEITKKQVKYETEKNKRRKNREVKSKDRNFVLVENCVDHYFQGKITSKYIIGMCREEAAQWGRKRDEITI